MHFLPNKDGINDVFMVKRKCCKNLLLRNLLFTTDGELKYLMHPIFYQMTLLPAGTELIKEKQHR